MPAVYYLDWMLMREDVKFIARRMTTLASEDIGNADPQALQVAVAAAGGGAARNAGTPRAPAQAVTYTGKC